MSPAGQSGVWVLRDGHPTYVPLKLGLDDDTYAEVRQGDLKPGDQVIIGEQSSEGNCQELIRAAALRSLEEQGRAAIGRNRH